MQNRCIRKKKNNGAFGFSYISQSLSNTYSRISFPCFLWHALRTTGGGPLLLVGSQGCRTGRAVWFVTICSTIYRRQRKTIPSEDFFFFLQNLHFKRLSTELLNYPQMFPFAQSCTIYEPRAIISSIYGRPNQYYTN